MYVKKTSRLLLLLLQMMMILVASTTFSSSSIVHAQQQQDDGTKAGCSNPQNKTRCDKDHNHLNHNNSKSSATRSVSRTESATGTFHVIPHLGFFESMSSVLQQFCVAATIVSIPTATMAFGISRQQSVDKLLESSVAGHCGFEVIHEERLPWAQSPLQLSIEGAGRFKYVVGAVVGNIALTLGLNFVLLCGGVVYHGGSAATAEGEITLLAIVVRSHLGVVFMIFVAVFYGTTLVHGISLFFDPYTPNEYLLLVGCLGVVYLFYIGWFLKKTLLNRLLWEAVVFEYETDSVNPASKIHAKRRQKREEELRVIREHEAELKKKQRLENLDLQQLLKLDSSDDEDLPPPPDARAVFIDVDVVEQEEEAAADGEDFDMIEDVGDFQLRKKRKAKSNEPLPTPGSVPPIAVAPNSPPLRFSAQVATTTTTTTTTTTPDMTTSPTREGTGSPRSNPLTTVLTDTLNLVSNFIKLLPIPDEAADEDEVDDELDQHIEAFVHGQLTFFQRLRLRTHQVVSWWFHDLGQWRYNETATREQRLLFHLALPVIEGCLATAPRFFMFEFTLQTALVGAVVAGELLSDDPEKACKAQGILTALGMGAFMALVVWLKPIQPRVEYYTTLSCCSLEFVVAVLVTIVRTNSHWMEKLASALFFAQLILTFVLLFWFCNRAYHAVVHGKSCLHHPPSLDGNSEHHGLYSDSDSRRIHVADLLDRPLLRGKVEPKEKKHFSPRPEGTDQKLIKVLRGSSQDNCKNKVKRQCQSNKSNNNDKQQDEEQQEQQQENVDNDDAVLVIENYHDYELQNDNLRGGLDVSGELTIMNSRLRSPTGAQQRTTTFDEIDNELRRAHREAQESSANLRRFAVDATGEIGDLKQEHEAKALSDLVRVEKLRREIEKIADV